MFNVQFGELCVMWSIARECATWRTIPTGALSGQFSTGLKLARVYDVVSAETRHFS